MAKQPLQNRVLPTGEIVSDPARGTFTGNRGIIHRPDGTLGTSRWSHNHWIICTLTHPRGTYHGPMPARGWSALFFLDEAVALAAGHRPCHYCRRDAYLAYRDAWAAAVGTTPDHKALDRGLHMARVTRKREQVRHEADMRDLPDGTFVLHQGRPCLVLDAQLFPYERSHYGPPIPRPTGAVTVLTPAPSVDVLRNGFRPIFHTSTAPGS